MQELTDARTTATTDQLWFCEHPAVFTLGLAADRSHVLAPGNIPVVKTDRGGQVTYHGPGQLMIYPLVDLRRSKLGVRQIVSALEDTIINYCQLVGVAANSRCDAPGVYVDGAKLASVGLRVRRGASYHGLALNVDMDLEPFSRINPCGFEDLAMTDLARLGVSLPSLSELAETIAPIFAAEIGKTSTLGSFDHPLANR